MNGCYFGNVLFGGRIGLLAVHPATGAMYTLEPKGITPDWTLTSNSDPEELVGQWDPIFPH